MKELTNNTKTWQILNVVAFVATIVVNVLSTALPLNGRTPGEISDSLPSYFTPAGYAFSIWSLIYLGLLGYVIYQALPGQRQNPHLAQVRGLFIVSSLANIAWIFAWHYDQYVLSILIMVGLLLTLIAIYQRLAIGQPSPNLSQVDRLLLHFPFSLYMGWITVATIANVASVVNYLGWDGFGLAEPLWSAIMMVVATAVAGGLLFNRRNLAYAGVLVWALLAIRVAYPDVAMVANTAVLASLLIAFFAAVGWQRARMRVA